MLVWWNNIVKNRDKSKNAYSGYGIVFDGAGWWGFGNDVAWNAVNFAVDNSLSSLTDNSKNNF